MTKATALPPCCARPPFSGRKPVFIGDEYDRRKRVPVPSTREAGFRCGSAPPVLRAMRRYRLADPGERAGGVHRLLPGLEA